MSGSIGAIRLAGTIPQERAREVQQLPLLGSPVPLTSEDSATGRSVKIGYAVTM